MKNPIHSPSLMRLSLVLLASAAPVAHGATRTWTGPTGDSWNTLGDWNGGGAVPGLGDTVRLGYASAATDDVTVNFNMSYADSALAALTINASGLNGILTLQQSATASQMNATAEVIGLDVTGNLYAQSGGSNTTDSLTLGELTGGWGFYQLSGSGSLTSDHLLVGDAGTGTFTQSGGTAQPADIVLGNQAGSVANSYTQAGGTLSMARNYAVDPWLFVGKSGQGTFNLSGGSLMLSSILYGNDWSVQFYAGGLILGLDATSTGNGFNLSGTGTISAEQGAEEMIGVNGTGIFHQTGGTNDADGLVLGCADFITDPLSGSPSSGTGVYQLDGGILSSGSGESIGANGAPGSVFYQTGGSNTASGYGLGISAGCSYELSGGTLSTTNMSLGGLFNLTGGGSLSSSPSACALSMSGGEFRLNGHAVTVASIVGDSGTIDNGGGGNGVLTVLGGGQSYLGDLVDGDSGLLGLTKTTGGSQGLGGNNTYGNATSVLGGVLQAASDTGFSPNSSFIVNGGTLDANGHHLTIKNLSGSGGEVRFGENGSITAGDATYTSYAGAVNGPSGTFHKTGSNGFAFSGGGDFGGTFDIQQGSLIVNAANGLPVASNVSIGARTTLDVWHDQALASIAGSGTLSLLASTLTLGSNSSGGGVMQGGGGPSGFGGTFYGSGTIVKAQASDFTIGFGPEDMLANTESSIAFQVTGGNLILNKAAGTNAIAGPVTIAGGTLRISRNEQISDSSSVTIDDGQFSVANPIPGVAFGFSETIGNLRGAGGSIDLGDSHLTVAQSASDEFDGSLLGNAGVFTKSGAATLTVGDVSGFNGTLQVTAGRLTLKGSAGVPKFTLAGGTFLRFDTASINLVLGGIQPGTGGTVEYLNSSIFNGYLRGPGTHQILAGGSSSFINVTTFSSTVVQQDGSADLVYFTNGGRFTNNASLTLDGCTNSASGTLTVNNTITTIDLTNDGVVLVNSGGVLDNLYGDVVAGGGSRMTVNAGGAIHLGDSGSLELDGALLVNNGSLDGTLDVNYGSLAKGSGSFGTVNLTDGGRFSPGNSPGMALISNMDFGPGGTYTFELNSAHATPGNGADFLNISGALAISAGSTANSRFTIGIASLNSAAQAAPLADFDATKAWHFTLATAAGGISGFNPAAFAIDSSGFANPLLGGHFQVSLSGSSLMLDFVPLTTYASWAASYSLTGADALPTADPDGDGLTNLLEYAFGSNPKAADVTAGARLCTVISGGVRYLGLSYQRPYGPNAPQDITYAVQRSVDLANPAAWSFTGLVLDSQSDNALLGLETVVVRSTTPMGASPTGHEFLRLRVSQ